MTSPQLQTNNLSSRLTEMTSRKILAVVDYAAEADLSISKTKLIRIVKLYFSVEEKELTRHLQYLVDQKLIKERKGRVYRCVCGPSIPAT